MTRRGCLAVAFLGLFAAAGSAQSRKKEVEFKEFTSVHKFNVFFPEKGPKETTKKLPSRAGELEQATATVELRDATYSVTVTVLPEAARPDPKKVIDGVRDGIKGKDGKVESDAEIRQGDAKLPGREMVFDFKKNVLKTRVFLVDDRLYQVVVTGSKSAVTAATADRFFAGFEVTK